MLDVALHAGTEHPSLTWVLLPSMLTFLAGIAIGHYSGTISGWFRSDSSTPE